MSSQMNLLKSELFGNLDSAISDIKFYPGESRECSIEEISETLLAAIHDIKAGNGRDIDLAF